jgi:hypothetical protein
MTPTTKPKRFLPPHLLEQLSNNAILVENGISLRLDDEKAPTVVQFFRNNHYLAGPFTHLENHGKKEGIVIATPPVKLKVVNTGQFYHLIQLGADGLYRMVNHSANPSFSSEGAVALALKLYKEDFHMVSVDNRIESSK